MRKRMERILTACVIVAAAGTASAQVTIDVGDVTAFPGPPSGVSLDGPNIPDGRYTSYEVTADWSALPGDTQSISSNAFFILGSAGSVFDSGFTAYTSLFGGEADGDANNSNPASLSWSGFFDFDYFGGDPLFFLPGVGFSGSGALFSNVSVTLGFDFVDVQQPTADITLGVVATDRDIFSIDTIGSNFDTTIGLYDGDGNFLGSNDDIDFSDGNLQSELADLQLDAGEYFLAVSGFSVFFLDGFSVEPDDLFGPSLPGDFVGQVNGTDFSGSVGPGEFQWVSFTVVPAPGTVSLLGLAGLAATRRRRN